MPAKTQTERLIEKQIKEQKKKAEQELKQRKEQQRLLEAQSIINNFRIVNGLIIMDDDTEELFSIIMKSYADNKSESNHVVFDMMKLPPHLQYNMNIYLRVLKLLGMVVGDPAYMGTNVLVHISDSAKNYFSRKQEALETEHFSAQQRIERTHKQFDVFISHAAKDKMSYVDELYSTIRKLGIQIFYDTDSIS